MTRKFEELRKRMTPERRRKVAERTQALLAAITLSDIRAALDMTQEEMAARLEVAQSNVSRLERRDDMLVSPLQQFVSALGGELEIIARFPHGAVRLWQFEQEGENIAGR